MAKFSEKELKKFIGFNLKANDLSQKERGVGGTNNWQ